VNPSVPQGPVHQTGKRNQTCVSLSASDGLLQSPKPMKTGIPGRAINALSNGASTRALTAREQEVLALVARGKTNKEISSDLTLAIDTVRSHRKNICRKLAVHSTAELVSQAVLWFHDPHDHKQGREPTLTDCK
jgi:DNA-binding CsgD family transcriptional regulator